MAHSKLPTYFSRLFESFCKPELFEELQGDLEESFSYHAETEGLAFARRQYRKEVIKLFRPSVIRRFQFDFFHQISPDMFLNYLKVAIRNLGKDRVSSFINILGLTIGFASTFFILLFVYHELQVDQSFEHGDRVYRITNDERPYRESGRYLATTAPPFAPTLVEEYPEVEAAVRIRYADDVMFNFKHNLFYENKVIYVDPDFFTLFSFPLSKGDPAKAFDAPNSVVLTPSMAQKYFGNEDPLGKSILMNDEIPLQVTGVLQNDLKRTHLEFDFLISFSTFKVPFGYPVTMDSWGWISFHTYVLLQKGINPTAFNEKLATFAKKHAFADRPVRSVFELQPLKDIYFHSSDMMNTESFKRGNLNYTYGLLIVALLILLIAGFNFMNISTARSVKRTKEVGVRKVLGAKRGNLIIQFIGEALVVSMISMLSAIFLFEVLRNRLFSYLQWSFDFQYKDYFLMLPVLFALTLILGVLSSFYPAIFLSGLHPLNIFRGMIKSGFSQLAIRKALVVVQFAITVALIICSLGVTSQMNFIRNKNVGYDKSGVVSLKMQTDDFLERYQVAQKLFLQNPKVLSVTAGDVMDGDYGSVPMTPAGAEEGIAMHLLGGHFNFFTTLGIDVIEGRDFSSAHPIDTATGIIINEAALKVFGWQDPIGQKLQVNTNIDGEVIGVVRDFHFNSLHDPIEPIVTVVPRTHMENIILKIDQQSDLDQTIASLKSDWQKIAPELPFQFSFLDDNLNLRYQADQQFSRSINFFSMLAIIIAGMGLYGMIAIIASYRIKEIGIRKILGASVMNIYVLLARNFILLVLLANVIAVPIAWWLVQKWLEGFAYHTDIHLFVFLGAICISIGIAILSLSYQVIKSALENPINAIRKE